MSLQLNYDYEASFIVGKSISFTLTSVKVCPHPIAIIVSRSEAEFEDQLNQFLDSLATNWINVCNRTESLESELMLAEVYRIFSFFGIRPRTGCPFGRLVLLVKFLSGKVRVL